jgi:pimeloyl-ACP methyl ester carboxylesterase
LLSLLPATVLGGAFNHPPPGTRVYVRDHVMHIYCIGAGSPAVIMDSGLGGTSLDWTRIQPLVATSTRVCAYDRSGYGWSDAASGPRTSYAIAQELRQLLSSARIPAPYVLVGHSFGGFNVRLFANAYPEDTAGLVLVDASHEEQFARLEKAGGGMVAPRGDFVLAYRPTLRAQLPREIRPVALALMSTPAAYSAVYGELAAFRLSAAQVAHRAGLPEVPTVVVTRGLREWPKTAEGDRKEAIWRELQKDLARRQARAVHLIAKQSGHYIPLEQPQVVSYAICIAVETARAGNPLMGVSSAWLRQRCRR